jgi:hypothetical protein
VDVVMSVSDRLAKHKMHRNCIRLAVTAAKLELNAQKCVIDTTEMLFIGFMVTSIGIHMEGRKVVGINTWPVLVSTAQHHILEALANHYRRCALKMI